MEIDIDRLALLARIKLNSQEKDKLKQEFEGILGFIAQLSEVDTSSIEGPKAGRATEEENVMREDDDSNTPGVQTEVLIKEAPLSHKGFVKVKNVFNK
jgi:aspartyl-tRNA(Asn)/glutamyl-tRNA(Gln) amidotransferase subunit C